MWFSSAGPKATLAVRKEKSYNLCERNAYIRCGEENLIKPHSCYASAKENTRKTGGGGLGGDRGKGREEGGVVGGNIVGGKPVEVMLI